ncbi:MAG: aldose epimerase family protein [Chloroflexota bacterium]
MSIDADHRFLLASPSGVTALVSTWGAALVALQAPDRDGRFDDVVLGFDTVEEYRDNARLYFGATIGRVAGRIRGARFTLDDRVVVLPANGGDHHLHGGAGSPFDQVDWAAVAVPTPAGPSVRLSRVSPDGEEGYPGELSAAVTYTLTPDDELHIDYEATTDRTTPLSMTNHAYWNLAGAGAHTVLDHELQVFADRYTPVDADLLPVGTVEPVEGTPLDFREPRVLGDRIAELERTGSRGYDHNFVLPGTGDRLAARLRHPGSGRVLEVRTTQPCMNVYSGNMMAPSVGKMGRAYPPRSGICLEPAGYLDAVNIPAFEPVWLRPGETYRQSITLRLTTDR